MDAQHIVELLSDIAPLVATTAIRDPFQIKISGNNFTFAFNVDAVRPLIGGEVASPDKFVLWLNDVAPTEIRLGSEGEELVVTADKATLHVSPNPRGQESAELYFVNPTDGLADWLVL